MKNLYGRICSRCTRELPKTKSCFPWMNDKTKPEWCEFCILEISEDLFESIDWKTTEETVRSE